MTDNIFLLDTPRALRVEEGKSSLVVRCSGLKQTSFFSPFLMQGSLQMAFSPAEPKKCRCISTDIGEKLCCYKPALLPAAC